MTARLSVVIANYNHGRFLAGCLDSALGQSHPASEVIVVDDGSTDDSRAVLKGYGTRVKTILQENAGQAGALSAGVLASTGDLVALLDADDGWHPDKAREVVDALSVHREAGWLRHKLELVDELLAPLHRTSPRFTGSGPLDPDPRYVLERLVTAPTSSIVLRRTAALAVLPLPASREFAFDADILILARLFAAGIPGYSLDRALGFYRRHGGQRFAAERDVKGMLRRELAVAESVARTLGRDVDRSVSSCKHRTVIAALHGAPLWDRRRLAPFAQGIGTAIGYADQPKLSMRQLAALLFAYLTPHLWLRKLERSMPLAGARPSGIEG
jgi:glycosyltransferase involved in cell wall biosynthesis